MFCKNYTIIRLFFIYIYIYNLLQFLNALSADQPTITVEALWQVNKGLTRLVYGVIIELVTKRVYIDPSDNHLSSKILYRPQF